VKNNDDKFKILKLRCAEKYQALIARLLFEGRIVQRNINILHIYRYIYINKYERKIYIILLYM